jgi:hypothetical protein
MYAITSRTNNEIMIEVVKNGEHVREKLDHKFQITHSEQVTNSMIRLSNVDPKIISYAEVEAPAAVVTEEEKAPESGRRGRRSNVTNEDTTSENQ